MKSSFEQEPVASTSALFALDRVKAVSTSYTLGPIQLIIFVCHLQLFVRKVLWNMLQVIFTL